MGTQVIFTKLATVRKRQGYTQRSLAKVSGINHVTIANIESGKTKNVNVQTLGKLCKALGLHSLSYITEIVTTEDK